MAGERGSAAGCGSARRALSALSARRSGGRGSVARSLQRYGQIAPVVVCVHNGSMEVVDGFKRLAAARLLLPRWTTLSVRVLAVDERGAKAAIYGLNRVSRCTH